MFFQKTCSSWMLFLSYLLRYISPLEAKYWKSMSLWQTPTFSIEALGILWRLLETLKLSWMLQFQSFRSERGIKLIFMVLEYDYFIQGHLYYVSNLMSESFNVFFKLEVTLKITLVWEVEVIAVVLRWMRWSTWKIQVKAHHG